MIPILSHVVLWLPFIIGGNQFKCHQRNKPNLRKSKKHFFSSCIIQRDKCSALCTKTVTKFALVLWLVSNSCYCME